MSLQIVRAAIEKPIIDALAALTPSVPVYIENQFYEEKEAEGEFALVSLQWGLTSEPSIGCAAGELLRGVLVVELFTPKGKGPGRGQVLAAAVLDALGELGGIPASATFVSLGSISGPSFTPLELQPHLMTRLSVPVRARYDLA